MIYLCNSLTSDDNLFSVTPTGQATLEYSSNGLKITGTSTNGDTFAPLVHNLPDGDYTIEYEVTGASSSDYTSDVCAENGMMACRVNNGDGIYFRTLSGGNVFYDKKGLYNPPTTIKWVVTGTTSKSISIYKDGTLLGTGTGIAQTKLFKLKTYKGRMIQIKNLKIYEN